MWPSAWRIVGNHFLWRVLWRMSRGVSDEKFSAFCVSVYGQGVELWSHQASGSHGECGVDRAHVQVCVDLV